MWLYTSHCVDHAGILLMDLLMHSERLQIAQSQEQGSLLMYRSSLRLDEGHLRRKCSVVWLFSWFFPAFVLFSLAGSPCPGWNGGGGRR